MLAAAVAVYPMYVTKGRWPSRRHRFSIAMGIGAPATSTDESSHSSSITSVGIDATPNVLYAYWRAPRSTSRLVTFFFTTKMHGSPRLRESSARNCNCANWFVSNAYGGAKPPRGPLPGTRPRVVAFGVSGILSLCWSSWVLKRRAVCRRRSSFPPASTTMILYPWSTAAAATPIMLAVLPLCMAPTTSPLNNFGRDPQFWGSGRRATMAREERASSASPAGPNLRLDTYWVHHAIDRG